VWFFSYRCLGQLKKAENDTKKVSGQEQNISRFLDTTLAVNRMGLMMSLYIKWVPPAWFQIKMGKKIIYTGFIPEMNKHGKIDVALLPIGGRDFTMNLTEAVQAAIMIKPLVAIPMHRFEGDPQKFKKQVEKKSDIKVAALQTGEVYHLE
jgi:hypothetical protein